MRDMNVYMIQQGRRSGWVHTSRTTPQPGHRARPLLKFPWGQPTTRPWRLPICYFPIVLPLPYALQMKSHGALRGLAPFTWHARLRPVHAAAGLGSSRLVLPSAPRRGSHGASIRFPADGYLGYF